MTRVFVALAALALGCAAPPAFPGGPCETLDLDAAYVQALVRECKGAELTACPAADSLGDAYQQAVYERLKECAESEQ